jgi:predicted RNase H-like HicB family nuclease
MEMTNIWCNQLKSLGVAMKNFEYTAVVWRESEGYVSKCPELGVASCGDTLEDAVSNLKEAVDLYLENAEVLGLMVDIEESLTAKEKYTAHLEVTVR